MPTSSQRGQAALQIAINQFLKNKQQNPQADDLDIIDNLEAVPSVIKDFLKQKASSHVANLQTQQGQSGQQNPLMGQQQIYQQITERLTSRFRPQMSQGRPVGGVQLPPDKALKYVQGEPDFESLPSEYQNYVLGVIGGQDAILLNKNMDAMQTQNFKDRHALALKGAENELQFGNSPTKMVQQKLEQGHWYVDATQNKLMKRQKNPNTGMDESVPLEPWESMHMINESPKLGFGDMTRFLNPQQQAGLAALQNNPNANVADIVQSVAKGRLQATPNQLQQIQSLPGQIPEATRGAIPGQLANLQTLSPERIQTMRDLGYKFDGSTLPSSGSPGEDDLSKVVLRPEFASQMQGTPSYKSFAGNAPSSPSGGAAAAQAVTSWLRKPAYIPPIAQNVLSMGQNLGSVVSGANSWMKDFATGILPNSIGRFLPPAPRIPLTTAEQMRQTLNQGFNSANDTMVDAVPSWLLPTPQ